MGEITAERHGFPKSNLRFLRRSLDEAIEQSYLKEHYLSFLNRQGSVILTITSIV